MRSRMKPNAMSLPFGMIVPTCYHPFLLTVGMNDCWLYHMIKGSRQGVWDSFNSKRCGNSGDPFPPNMGHSYWATWGVFTIGGKGIMMILAKKNLVDVSWWPLETWANMAEWPLAFKSAGDLAHFVSLLCPGNPRHPRHPRTPLHQGSATAQWLGLSRPLLEPAFHLEAMAANGSDHATTEAAQILWNYRSHIWRTFFFCVLGSIQVPKNVGGVSWNLPDSTWF